MCGELGTVAELLSEMHLGHLARLRLPGAYGACNEVDRYRIFENRHLFELRYEALCSGSSVPEPMSCSSGWCSGSHKGVQDLKPTI